MNEQLLSEAKTFILALIQSNRVMSWHSVHALVEMSAPDMSVLVPRALSELVQSNTIKRYEYTKDGNRRDEFYIPHEYRIII